MALQPRAFSHSNRLLAALPTKVLARWHRRFERVDLKLRETLSKPGKPIEHVYFPESGMISLLQSPARGVSVEVGLIGKEGFYGVPLLLGAQSSPMTAIVQGEGSALRLSAAEFTKTCDDEKPVRNRLLLYAQALHVQVTQTAVCNARHTLEERLARWLLEAHDRFEGTELPLSHEFLSLMLGSRRAGITEAMGTFRKAKLLSGKRGSVRILDRKGIEAVACECHKIVRAEYRRLL